MAPQMCSQSAVVTSDLLGTRLAQPNSVLHPERRGQARRCLLESVTGGLLMFISVIVCVQR